MIIKISSYIRLSLLIFTLACIGGLYSSPAKAQHLPDSADLNEYKVAIYQEISFTTPLPRTEGDSGFLRTIRQFYEARNNKTLWLSSAGRVNELVTILEQSWTHGLNPQSYNLDHIIQLQKASSLSLQKQLWLEFLLTEAAIKYGRDISGTRIKPEKIGEDEKYWRKPLEAEELLQILGQAADPVQILKNMAPQGQFYNALREELVYLTRQPDSPYNQQELTFGNGYLVPGQSHPEVPLLRERLGVNVDLALNKDPHYYDDHLAAAVIIFQKENNLEPDGVIGPNTLTLLNFTKQDRIIQVIANMERLRWLDQVYPPRYLLVNIPSQTLWAVENGEVVHEMKVVVGKQARPTMRFISEVEGIRFNPDWNVPISIKMHDFLPLLKQDPYALSDKGIEFMQGWGSNAVTIDPGSINWHQVGWREMSKIRMVQMPGDNNALGRIRVLMPNQYNIYLHDTNHRSLFSEPSRAFSSGCVRMEEPEKIANFVLKNNPEWHPANMAEILATTETTEISAGEPMPVFIVYQTIWLNAEGHLTYGTDLYKKDTQLVKHMQAQNMVPFFLQEAQPATDLASSKVMP